MKTLRPTIIKYPLGAMSVTTDGRLVHGGGAVGGEGFTVGSQFFPQKPGCVGLPEMMWPSSSRTRKVLASTQKTGWFVSLIRGYVYDEAYVFASYPRDTHDPVTDLICLWESHDHADPWAVQHTLYSWADLYFVVRSTGSNRQLFAANIYERNSGELVLSTDEGSLSTWAVLKTGRCDPEPVTADTVHDWLWSLLPGTGWENPVYYTTTTFDDESFFSIWTDAGSSCVADYGDWAIFRVHGSTFF